MHQSSYFLIILIISSSCKMLVCYIFLALALIQVLPLHIKFKNEHRKLKYLASNILTLSNIFTGFSDYAIFVTGNEIHFVNMKGCKLPVKNKFYCRITSKISSSNVNSYTLSFKHSRSPTWFQNSELSLLHYNFMEWFQICWSTKAKIYSILMPRMRKIVWWMLIM